uniref:Uncharacterized protein n=1 Tax=Mustela putorius furo TaxID=9669 RepID=M3Z195_MUSPF
GGFLPLGTSTTPTPARDQRDEAISRRAATSGGESEARRSPLRVPRAGWDPAVSGQRQRSSPGSQSPLKHLLWRLETEFENPPISGGWRGGPGQSRGGTARARRPSESWRSEPRVWLSPAQLLPPQPPPPSGYLETSGPGANSCRGRGPGRPREAKDTTFSAHVSLSSLWL